jgi:membrane protease YdiL (CAAX protease family)
MKRLNKNMILQIAIAIAGPSLGILLIFVLKHFLNISKPIASLIGFAVSSIFIVVLIPKLYKIPFGKIPISQYLKNLGFYFPKNWVEHLILGILVSIVLLSGLLMGSILTYRYTFNSSTINLGQILFSLTPGVWEEFCFRGIIMLVLLNATKSLSKAFIWQIIIFGICHIKGFGLLNLVDALSVFIVAIAFTYLVVKTKSLFAAIIAHFLYDSFLLVVQLPGGTYTGFAENAWLYSCLWISVGFTFFIIKLFTEKFNFYGHIDFLQIAGYSDDKKRLIIAKTNIDLIHFEPQTMVLTNEEEQIKKEKQRKAHEKTEKSHRLLALVNGLGFLAMLFTGFEEFSFLVKTGFLIGIIGNLVVYFFWNQVKSFALPMVYILDAILYCTKGYKFQEHGSQHAYIFFYIIGLGYLITGIITSVYRKRITH